MNEKNLSYLKDNIKYQGFGETLNIELGNQLQKGTSDFTIGFKTDVNKREIEANLHFRKSDSTDMYFFNKYDIRTTTELKNEVIAQTFYLNKGQGVTLKEAYNLLNGRAVHKELIDKHDQKYKAWIELDFKTKDKNGNFERKQYHQNYGYDLKEALSYFPIKEMRQDDEKEKLLRSLERGNVQVVTFETGGKEVKAFIEANPQYKSLNIYDNEMHRLNRKQSQDLMEKPENQGIRQDSKEAKEQKQEITPENKPEKTRTKSSAKKPDENGLIQKKRVSIKKGISL